MEAILNLLVLIGGLTLLAIFIGIFAQEDPDRQRRSQIRRIMDRRNSRNKGPINLNRKK